MPAQVPLPRARARPDLADGQGPRRETPTSPCVVLMRRGPLFRGPLIISLHVLI